MDSEILRFAIKKRKIQGGYGGFSPSEYFTVTIFVAAFEDV